MGGCSGGVAVMLINHKKYSRLNQLEDTSVDKVVLTVRLGGIKLVVSTAYVRPEEIGGLRKTINVFRLLQTKIQTFQSFYKQKDRVAKRMLTKIA